MESNNSVVKENLDIFLEELDGIDLVLNKLESRNSASVFEKLCANCESAFGKIDSLEISDIVASGLASKVIDALLRFRDQLVRLQNYKEALINYIEMTQGVQQKAEQTSNVVGISNDNPFLQNNNKTLDLNIDKNAA